MPNAEKLSAVAEIVDHFNESSAAVVTEYRGLTVKQVSELRRALGRDTTYAVVKNTLTRLAAAQAGVSIDASLLVGPTAIAFVKGDPVQAAKGLREFARANPLLIVKGGVLDGKSLTAAEVGKIADLESREVLLSKVAGVLKALPSRAAALFQAPLSQVARLAQALEDKRVDAGEVATGEVASDGEPAASEPGEVASAGEPVAGEPAASEPGEIATATEPVATEPVATEPVATEPDANQPVVSAKAEDAGLPDPSVAPQAPDATPDVNETVATAEPSAPAE